MDGFLKLKFKKTADTTFKIKIGMRLVNWVGNNIRGGVSNVTDEKPDTVWSDVEEIETDFRH